jgi:hypothetical protein
VDTDTWEYHKCCQFDGAVKTLNWVSYTQCIVACVQSSEIHTMYVTPKRSGIGRDDSTQRGTENKFSLEFTMYLYFNPDFYFCVTVSSIASVSATPVNLAHLLQTIRDESRCVT